MRKVIFIAATLSLAIVLIYSCKKNSDVQLPADDKPFQKLSQYQFFLGEIKNLSPNQGVLAYDLITPLFTDYAYKLRFVWMPKGTSAKYSDEETFDFPVGAILIKNFYYPDDFRKPGGSRKILETRVLIHKKSGWESLEYIWNDQQTDAILEQAGDSKKISWIDEKGNKQSTTYLFPNKNQCKNCHNLNNIMTPIGPKARYINSEYSYAEGKMNQIEKWKKVGYLTQCDLSAEKIAAVTKWDDTTANIVLRAKSYLEVNCAHCHRKEGNANTSGLYLLMSDNNPESWGIMKSPVAAGKASGNCLYDVVPGKPDESILVYRMDNLDPGIMMPELGRTMIHHEGVALIRAWISDMK
jgi:uncharacterized repeat protein (TIGR03806 family)